MEKTKVFDVLIVYSHLIAASASVNDNTAVKPFSGTRSNYNNSYEYFLETCDRMKIQAALTTSADFQNGEFTCYWVYKNHQWKKINEPCISQQIFDKFAPRTKINREYRSSIFADSAIEPFNNTELFQLFYDKQKTYRQLKNFTLPTVPLHGKSHKNIQNQLNLLKTILVSHPGKKDFSTNFVVKDRYGSGGNNIFKIKGNKAIQEIQAVLSDKTDAKFILQPFINFKKGYSYKKYSGYIDLRIIYLDGKAIQTYIRVAADKDFRCNEHQGGILEYISLQELPENILSLSDHISYILNMDNSLYALDFIVSDRGNVYLLEGNTGPGLDWNLARSKNERKSKELIRLVVSNIARRIDDQKYLDAALLPQLDVLMEIPSPQVFV